MYAKPNTEVEHVYEINGINCRSMHNIQDEFNHSPHIESIVHDVQTMESNNPFMSQEAVINSMESKVDRKLK